MSTDPCALDDEDDVLDDARRAIMTAAPIVMHLRPSNFFGGPEKQIVEHAVLLPDLGWRSVVASFQDGQAEVEIIARARERGLSVATVRTRGAYDPSAISKLRRLLRTSGTSVLVAHGYRADMIGFHAGRLAGVPVVPCVRGFTDENAKVRIYEAIDRLYLRRFPLIVAVSEGSARMLRAHGVHPEHIQVVPNAVTVPSVQILPANLRSEYNIPDGAPILVSAGRLSPEKGHEVLVRAVGVLAATGHHVHLVLLGVGPMRQQLAATAEQCGIAGHIHFGGFRHDVVACLAAADLVVNPSHSEGMPNIVLEAMSAGAPVLATAVGGVPEVLQEGVTGWLVTPGSPGQLAMKIQRILLDSERRLAVGRAARSAVSRDFTFAKQAQRWLRVYEASVSQT